MWDSVIAAYNAHGIRVLLSISDAPGWARPLGDDKSVEGLPEDPAKYAEFVARVSDRYRRTLPTGNALRHRSRGRNPYRRSERGGCSHKELGGCRSGLVDRGDGEARLILPRI